MSGRGEKEGHGRPRKTKGDQGRRKGKEDQGRRESKAPDPTHLFHKTTLNGKSHSTSSK
jgi:hypothetical protein